MSKTVIAIDPVTRLEGHLKVEVQVEDGKVADAWITGGMFRGFEAILRGRNPRDASQIVQRICGVCPVAHATASSLAIEAVCGVEVPENGRIARNLMLAGNYLQSNILHFYHLGGQDYFHGPDTVPFIPRYRNPDLRLSEEQNTLAMDEYIEALEVRQVCHQLVALFGGRMPHLQGILGGGAAQIPDRETILEYAARMKQVRKFVENRYLPLVYTIASRYMDMFEMAHGYKNALCVGVFPLAKKGEQFFNAGAYINGRDEPFDGNRILEDVRYSWFEPAPSGTPLQKSESNPQVDYLSALGSGDHPRVGGEKNDTGKMQGSLWGSPPRGRGKVPGDTFKIDVNGITPAWAGKRFPAPAWSADRRDHPRVGGEKWMGDGEAPSFVGSPPRGRGKGHRGRKRSCCCRITPAWAGKRLKRSHRSGIFISGPIPFHSVLHRPAGSGGSRAGRDGSPAGQPQNAGPA